MDLESFIAELASYEWASNPDPDFHGNVLSDYVHSLRLAQAKYGDPIGQGRHRVVFRDGDHVLKVPYRASGIDANFYEGRTQSNNPHEPRASCSLDDQLAGQLKSPCVLRMEYVEHVGCSPRPDWTWSVDCGQVGRNKDGKVVAYDWERM